MDYSTVTTLIWANAEHSAINCMVNFDVHGVVPFTASQYDPEAHGVEIFDRCVAGDFGAIAVYVAPPVRYAPLTAWQIRKALNTAGLRATVEAAITGSSDQDLKDAWQYASSFERNHPLVASMAAALGKTDAEIDALFILGATL